MADAVGCGKHNLFLENRVKTTVTGVTDVDRFDEHEVRLFTEQGRVTFRGENLHLTTLSLEVGEVSFDGLVISVVYDGARKKEDFSFLSRLFR